MPMQLAVVGSGYVGLVTGAGFADFGNDVICVDSNPDKIARLKQGEVPIYEPGLDALIANNMKAGRLQFTTDLEGAIRASEVIFIAVGTPPAADGSADLSSVFAVGEMIGRHMNDFKVIVTKSTVPVGTADQLKKIIGAHAAHPFGVASNPEFLKEGTAIEDFVKPDRVIIGSDNPRALTMLRHLYSPFVRTNDRVQVMDARSAELTKYAANALLATRISFMNDLAVLAEKVGADIELVRKGVGSDARIGPKFLFPGPGYGGSCFPKDLSALVHTAQAAGHELSLVRAADEVNKRQKQLLFGKVQKHFDGNLKGRTVAVWGIAFKPKTDDIREAPALALMDSLLAHGASVRAHDPQAMQNAKSHYGDRVTFCDQMYAAAEGSDALVLVTEWHEYRRPDFLKLKRLLRHSALFDGRNIWDPEELRNLGFTYSCIGRP